MAKATFIEVGILSKPHGVKGELKASFKYIPDLKALLKYKTISVNNDGILPWFIENISFTGKEDFILKLEDCNSRNKAEELAGSRLFVPKEQFEELFIEDESGYTYLCGYTAVDADDNLLGKIEDVLLLPLQSLAQIFIDGKELLVPLNEDTVLKVEKKKKNVRLQIPEGLLEL